jgi:signal transduction histidine kinase
VVTGIGLVAHVVATVPDAAIKPRGGTPASALCGGDHFVPDGGNQVEGGSAEQAGRQHLLSHYHELAELAGSLAHEIKNPLSVIRMNMDLLAEDLADAETPRERRARAKIETVHDQCTRLENLLNDFLKFARVRTLDLVPGNLNDQLQSVLRLFAVQAREARIRVLPHFDNELPSVLLDQETIRAALINLIKNALEAMPDGGALTVITRITRNGVALDLIDNGTGMDERTAVHMFEAFYSTKQGGSGLGLPIARKIIEAHGGRISVQSDVGRGTKFTLEFPTPRRI